MPVVEDIAQELENESAFMNFLIGTGRWFVDKRDGICRNVLIVSNSLGLTTDEELEQYKEKIASEYELYKQTPAGQSFAGNLGESGILPMLIIAPIASIRGGLALPLVPEHYWSRRKSYKCFSGYFYRKHSQAYCWRYDDRRNRACSESSWCYWL